jgi:thiamine biosynthesis protein ThiI
MFQAYLLKYAEIGIKGKNRYKFENALCGQIEKRLNHIDGKYKVINERGRIYVEASEDFDRDETVEVMKNTFGVTQVCEVKVIEDKEWNNVCEETAKALIEMYGENNLNFTFKVKSRRSDKRYAMTSPEVCMEMGHFLLERFPDLKVDVHEPKEIIWVEIRDKVYVYSKIIKGVGGMPLGTNGKAMLLLSGGIDSPVAGYMIARRGMLIDAVYFHAPPYTSERAKEKVVDLARIVSSYTGLINLHIINFTDIQMYIYQTCPHDELTIIMRRYMMKIAERIALENDCLALITGESIGQVASQTAHSLLTTNDAVESLPVYRPLIAFDKQDIVDISQEIGTYETSILPFEDCCTIFVAKHPVTKPGLKYIQSSEKKLVDIDSMVEKALETREIVHVTPKR